MGRPVGLQSKLKDNSNKKYREHDEWMLGKKIGRKKQQWVWDDEAQNLGHWEKV